MLFIWEVTTDGSVHRWSTRVSPQFQLTSIRNSQLFLSATVLFSFQFQLLNSVCCFLEQCHFHQTLMSVISKLEINSQPARDFLLSAPTDETSTNYSGLLTSYQINEKYCLLAFESAK